MSNKTIDMQSIRQMLRLYALGRGTKYISQSTGIARNTVKKYLYKYVLSEKTAAQIEAMSDAQMAKIFLTQAKIIPLTGRQLEIEPLLPSLAAMLKKRGVTKQMVYDKYKQQCPDGYKHSSFLEKLNRFMCISKPSMRIMHKAGDKLFVDFTGQKLQLVDAATGELQEVEVFVAILGCSQLTFVIALPSQRKEDFITGCECALHFFGGVPQAIVPDNLKSAVTKASRYEAQLNESFAAFAEHYKTFGYPTRTYKPKDKALVEGAVKIIYTTIFAKIDQTIYHDIQELNKDILVHLAVHNNSNLTGESYSRMQQFNEIEKDFLAPLNPYLFEMMTLQLATVNKFGHVLLSADKKYYSVHYSLIGKRLKIKYTSKSVTIYDVNEIVANHERLTGKGFKYVTLPEHVASHHKFQSEWSPTYFMEHATKVSAVVAKYIAKVLARDAYPEQTYKACSGILSFAKRVGDARLTNACKRADSFGLYNYTIIDQILRSKADAIAFEDELLNTIIPNHENIRGQDYYE